MGTHSTEDVSQQNSRYNTRQNSQVNNNRQKRPSLGYNLESEPNPFEQSFRVQSVHSPASSSRSPPSQSVSRKQSSPSLGTVNNNTTSNSSSSNTSSHHHNGSDQKPVLPPLSSIASPSDPSSAWSANLQNSLRAGPLSPAMLAGPQPSTPSGQNPNPNSVAALATSANLMHPPLFGFDPSGSFRTGLTPSTGLTPLVGGPVAFPPPSPNTAAFLAMVNAGNGTTATITPNTLTALTGVLQQQQQQQQSSASAPNVTVNGSAHHQNISPSSPNPANGPRQSNAPDPSHQPAGVAPSSTYNNHDENQSYDAASATTHAANGLFLLSQAHQELTKREEAQRQGRALTNGDISAAGGAPKPQDAKKGTKRKNEAPPKPAPTANKKTKSAAATAAAPPTVAPPPHAATRSTRRQSVAASSSNQEEIDEGDYDDVDEDEDMDEATSPISATGPSAAHSGGRKKPETEEEKRKNFLERNRQAALKCRQRKKQWLQQLQAKNEYLTNENERLTAALVSSREEIARLSQLVGGAGVGLAHAQGVPSMGPQGQAGGGNSGGNGGGGSGAAQPTNGLALTHASYMQPHHPIALPVSLAQGSAPTVVPSNPPPPAANGAMALANGASPPLSAASVKGMVMGSPRSPVSGSEGRSSRGSFRDSGAHGHHQQHQQQQGPPPPPTSSSSGSAHARSEYGRDMRERELGHAGMRQAVAVNGRGYGY